MKKIVSFVSAAALAAAVSFAAVQPSEAMPAPTPSSDNSGAGVVLGVLALVVGAVIVNAVQHAHADAHTTAAAPDAKAHTAACQSAYKSYVASSDTFLGFDGARHHCAL